MEELSNYYLSCPVIGKCIICRVRKTVVFKDFCPCLRFCVRSPVFLLSHNEWKSLNISTALRNLLLFSPERAQFQSRLGKWCVSEGYKIKRKGGRDLGLHIITNEWKLSRLVSCRWGLHHGWLHEFRWALVSWFLFSKTGFSFSENRNLENVAKASLCLDHFWIVGHD